MERSCFARSLLLSVSIQLVSPASGDVMESEAPRGWALSFHSISFPSEWGPGFWVLIDFAFSFPFN